LLLKPHLPNFERELSDGFSPAKIMSGRKPLFSRCKNSKKIDDVKKITVISIFFKKDFAICLRQAGHSDRDDRPTRQEVHPSEQARTLPAFAHRAVPQGGEPPAAPSAVVKFPE